MGERRKEAMTEANVNDLLIKGNADAPSEAKTSKVDDIKISPSSTSNYNTISKTQ